MKYINALYNGETPITIQKLCVSRGHMRRKVERWYRVGLTLGDGEKLYLGVQREGRVVWTTVEEYQRFLRAWSDR